MSYTPRDFGVDNGATAKVETLDQNGGPAYPGNSMPFLNTGMTLRDHFAGQAMQGWVTTFGPAAMHGNSKGLAAELAAAAYQIADAMLAERKKARA